MRPAVLLALFLTLAATGAAEELLVPVDYASIQDALNAAASGDTIRVSPGTYHETIDFMGKAVELKSTDGADHTFIYAGFSRSVVVFRNQEGPDSVLSGFTLSQGRASYGAGILCDGASPMVVQNIIVDNQATQLFGGGGGIACLHGAAPYIADNLILSNEALDGGGIYSSASFPTVTGNLIQGNDAVFGGGLCCARSSPAVMNNLFLGNSAQSGAGIYCNESSPTLTNDTFYVNAALAGGGALCAYNGSNVMVLNSILWENTASKGPEIWAGGLILSSKVLLRFVDLKGGVNAVHLDPGGSLDLGEGLLDIDPLFVDPGGHDLRLRQDPCQPGTVNACVDGGDINTPLIPGTTRTDGVQDEWIVDLGYHYPATQSGAKTVLVPIQFPTIQTALNAVIDGDTVLVKPGTYFERIDFLGKAVTLRSDKDGNILTQDIAPLDTVIDGGGLGSVAAFRTYESRNALLEGFTLTNGAATIAYGGGIVCEGSSPTLITNVIIDNGADGGGGGLACLAGAKPLVLNCFFIANTTSGPGGGLYLDGASSMVFTNNTCTRNEAGVSGGGIFCTTSGSTITNSIVWQNTAPLYAQIAGSATVTYCDVGGGWPGTGNIDENPFFVNPGLRDYHIGFLSPCRDQGSDEAANLPETDFDGDPRTAFDGPDMGADEVDEETIARTIHVPESCASIQAAIDTAEPGDTILVAEGTYAENIDFLGKPITVRSDVDGDPMTRDLSPSGTVIDGGLDGSAVVFTNGEEGETRLEGFTLTRGTGTSIDAYRYGGAVFAKGASPVLNRLILQGNHASGTGGALYLDRSSPLLTDLLVYDNSASSGGGAAALFDSDPVVVNSTFYGNTASDRGGALFADGAAPELINTVLWNNAAPTDAEISGAIVAATYSDVKGGWPGTGNIDMDPLFVDPSTRDFHLLQSSPCVDRGTDTAPGLPETDLEGHARSIHKSVDMGCDEVPFIIHVPSDYATIQEAIDHTYGGEWVLVAPGTYVENVDFLGRAILVRSDGDGDPDTHDLAVETTVIDANKTGSAVVFQNQETQASVLEGFTLTNGYGTFVGPLRYGGGIFCGNGSSPTIKGNIVSSNSASLGGGIGCYLNAAPLIEDNFLTGNFANTGSGIGCFEGASPTISDNLIQTHGGFFGLGIACSYGSDAIIVHNQILDNHVGYESGGIRCEASSPVIRGNLIRGNQVKYSGGGISCIEGSSPLIEGNRIEQNVSNYSPTTDNEGGGLYCEGSSPRIRSNWIHDNSADRGAGILARDKSFPLLSNNWFTLNNASGSGGGIYAKGGSKVTIINDTWVGNNGEVIGGAAYIYYDSSLDAVNWIVRDNTAPTSPQIEGVDVNITFSDVKGGWSGPGNIDADPLFVDAGSFDLHLREESPCKDAGDNSAPDLPEEDLDGNPRIADDVVDMGADEYLTDLYAFGVPFPGKSLSLKMVGPPSGGPVGFWVSLDFLYDPWIAFPGPWYLNFPIYGPFGYGSLSSEGVKEVIVTLPTKDKKKYYLQGFVQDRLTGMIVIEPYQQ